MSKTTNTRMTMDVPTNVHKKIKMLSAYCGKSMRDVLLDLVDRGLEGYEGGVCLMSHEPNEETKKAIKESKNAKGSIRAKTVEELFEKLKS